MVKRLTREQLIAVGWDVRKELESFAGVTSTDYNLDEYTWDMTQDLAGHCMYGAIMVWQALRALGRNPRLVRGVNHWFTHCDGYLIDVTASQFGMDDVVVSKLERKKNFGWVPESHDAGRNYYWNANFRSRSIVKMGQIFVDFQKIIEKTRIVMFNRKEAQNAVIQG